MKDYTDFEKLQQISDLSSKLKEELPERKTEYFSIKNQDAKITIQVLNGDLEAQMTIEPPHHRGWDVTLAQVKNVLRDKGITYGIDWDAIQSMVNNKTYSVARVIARGTPPVNGEDGYIRPFIKNDRRMRPKILNDGSVDFKNLGMVCNVRSGQEICEIIPATQGTPGRNVLGYIIPPVHGKPCKDPQGINTRKTPDGRFLIAIADGNLVYDRGTYSVNTVMTIPRSVDVSTGNIDFIGDVIVRENVEEGFMVHARSVLVKGMVNGAEIIAEKDIVIKNGVVRSKLSSQGNIQVGFAEVCKINCGGELKTSSLINCDIQAKGDIDCTKAPGSIIGGTVRTTGDIKCNVIGHKNYPLTTVWVGGFAALAEELKENQDTINKLDEEISKLNINVLYLKHESKKNNGLSPEKEDLYYSDIRLIVQKELAKQALMKRYEEICELLKNKEASRVYINQHLYPNVILNIGGSRMKTDTHYGKCVIYDGDDGVSIF